MTHQPKPYRYVDADDFCLSARLLPDLDNGGFTETLSITIEGSDEPQSVHIPLDQVENLIAGLRLAAGAVSAAVAPPTHQTTAEAALAAVEAALGDTLLPDAREEALAGIAAVLPEAADRAAVYAEVAERLAADAEQGDKDGLTRIYRRSAAKQVREWADELLRMAGETQPAETTEPEETDEERADREETERDHARGDHTHCGITCETEMPTEQLRNFVIAKGYPGTKGALAELERRAAAGARQDGAHQ